MKKSERDHIKEVFKGCVAILNTQKRDEFGEILAVDESHIMRLLDSYERLVEALKESLAEIEEAYDYDCVVCEGKSITKSRQALAEVEE